MMKSLIQVPIIRTDRSERQSIAARLGLRGKMTRSDVVDATNAILDAVRQEGDAALLRLTEQYDRVRLNPDRLRVSEREISEALEQTDSELLAVLHDAAANIRRFHEAQNQTPVDLDDGKGARVGLLVRPLDQVGIYVPGGTAPLPSSVLMNALPARAAGVRRVIMCTPPRPDGRIAPAILAAASLAGIDAIYKVGGAQAIAAMAFGTQTIPAVDKICGPGNIYVNTAKRLVFGQCDIDLFAGPSEILIIADGSADPAFIAADMLSQAEHDRLASAILITTSETVAAGTASEIQRRAQLMPRSEILSASLKDYSAILVVPDLGDACAFANELAPEHLELCVSDPRSLIPAIRNAGAIFLGHYSPEPLGDYFAGPNHVLPTSGTSRFFSPLNTADFQKKISVIDYSRDALESVWERIALFAEAEQLTCHAEAIRVRFGQSIADRTARMIEQNNAIGDEARRQNP